MGDPPDTTQTPSRLDQARGSATVRAAGVASTQLVAIALALLTTVALARALGTADYGELARMASVVTILLVPATALQVASARDMTLGRLGSGARASASLDHWIVRILLLAGACLALCLVLRDPIATLLQVSQPWAAAMVVPAGVLWLSLALQRGILLGVGGYREVGTSLVAEQGFRMLSGIAAALAGADVGVIFLFSIPLATLPSILLTGCLVRRGLGAPDRRSARSPLRGLAIRNPVPMAGLTLFAIIQNADVIAVGHYFDADLSGAYAQASVAAKGIIWVAVGLGLYLLPEAAREASKGVDARHLLARTTGLLTVVAAPVLALFYFLPGPVLELVFGDKAALAEAALPSLTAAMAFLALAYLAMQYLLAIGRRYVLALLAAAAVMVPVVVAVRDSSLEAVAVGLMVLDFVLAALLMASCILRRPHREDGLSTTEAAELSAAEASAAAEAAIP